MARGDGRYRQWASCERKARFASYHVAQRRASALHLRAYECSICSGWHLTHLPTDQPNATFVRYDDRTPSQGEQIEMKIAEATRILNKLLEREKAGVELPKATIDRARENLDQAKQERATWRRQRAQDR